MYRIMLKTMSWLVQWKYDLDISSFYILDLISHKCKAHRATNFSILRQCQKLRFCIDDTLVRCMQPKVELPFQCQDFHVSISSSRKEVCGEQMPGTTTKWQHNALFALLFSQCTQENGKGFPRFMCPEPLVTCSTLGNTKINISSRVTLKNV